MQEEITRNHCCKDIDAFLDLIVKWLSVGCSFAMETSLQDNAKNNKNHCRVSGELFDRFTTLYVGTNLALSN